jgi:putative drug exporter of the RND superfamily
VLGPATEPLARRFGVFLSRTGNAARYVIIFDHDPFNGVAIARLNELDGRLPDLLARAGLGGTRTTFGGGTALADQTIDDVLGDLTRIAPVVLAASFALLALLLRAIVAPLYLLGASVLALAAALGLTTYVFQDAFGGTDLTYYVPFAASILLVSLGSDYNIFVAGRIWDEARRSPFREAVAEAAPRAARAITVAGLVLAFSFALLAIVQLRSFRELAFAMCVGVLLDAFVVRSLFVPALVSLFGSAGSWPSGRLRPRRDRRTARARRPVFVEQPSGTRFIGRR